jgi:hypothetical protein
MNYINRSAAMSAETDVFARKPIQKSVLETIETFYKRIAPV